MSGPGEIAFGILVGAATGYGAGLVHFRSLPFVVERLLAGRPQAVAVQVARLGLLAGVLALLALWGAQALLPGAAGVMLARNRVLARDGAGR